MDNIVRLDATNWKEYTAATAKLQRALAEGLPLGTAIASLAGLMRQYSVVASDRFSDIADSYRLMCGYLLKGYEDTQREELYRQLVRRLYRLLADMALSAKLKFAPAASYISKNQDNIPLDIDGLRDRLESFVSEMAMLSLEPDGANAPRAKALYEERQATVSKAFAGVLRSGQWSREQAADMAALLLSPTIDSADALVLCSAVMMAALLSPDPYKVVALANIYKAAADTKLRERALVGWVLALDAGDYSLFPEVGSLIDGIVGDEAARVEITELQMQIVYCMGAERDTEKIQKDVMPTLLKNQNLEITRYGIREKEEDPMDDILHGDETDKRMEEMEKTVQQMVDMQKRGVDIYFGGFSKMKRFGFFYTLCNWFMPFYSHHPGLEHLSREMLESGFMKTLFENGPFCDSDKYSFALGLSTVYERLPDNIREMLSGSGAVHVMGDSGADVGNPAYVRRFYLQDLYRFFRINDCRTMFHDPFSGHDAHLFMDNVVFGSHLHAEAQKVVRFLLKRRQYDEAGRLLERYYEAEDIDDALMKARVMMYRQNYVEAERLFATVLEADADDKPALRGAALASFYNGNYDKAARLYSRLFEIYPDKSLYRLNLAIALINGGKADEGVNVLYELYYQSADDMDVRRALAWGLLCTKRVEKSAKLYAEILKSDGKTAADSLNAGYCAWFNGELDKAVSLFKDYLKLAGDKAANGARLLQKFDEDKSLLDAYAIPRVNRLLVAGMAG